MINKISDKNINCLKTIFMYILIIIILMNSGMPYTDKYSSILTIITFILIMLAVIYLNIIKNKLISISVNSFIMLVLLCYIYIYNIVINWDTDLTHHLGILINFCSIFLISNLINIRKFINIFVNLMIFFSITSLIFYILGIISTDIIYLLPEFNTSIYFRNACLYFYSINPFTFEPIVNKNLGIFREPGMYQIYLNMTLFFLVSMEKKDFKKIFLILFTIFSTFSTSGILAAILILSSIFKEIKKMTLQKIMKFFVPATGISFIVMSYIYRNYYILFDKFNINSNSYASFATRRNGTIMDIILGLDNPILGIGYTKYSITQIIGTANSLTSIFAQYGLFFLIIILIGIFCFIKSSNKSLFGRGGGMIAIIIMTSTQNVLLFPFWLLIAFYGISLKKQSNEKYEQL